MLAETRTHPGSARSDYSIAVTARKFLTHNNFRPALRVFFEPPRTDDPGANFFLFTVYHKRVRMARRGVCEGA